MIVFYFINDPVAEINEQYNAADLNEILEEFYNLPEEKYALIGLVDDRRYKYRILYKDYDEYLAFITDDDGKDISFALLTYDECVGKLRCVFDKGFILND